MACSVPEIRVLGCWVTGAKERYAVVFTGPASTSTDRVRVGESATVARASERAATRRRCGLGVCLLLLQYNGAQFQATCSAKAKAASNSKGANASTSNRAKP